ncbi:MAG TPA: cupredoxin domain-containing protein [Anaerolineales bacterium]|nr:cupredoxin domain-containing protein [Anaerolineales bacterium]
MPYTTKLTRKRIRDRQKRLRAIIFYGIVLVVLGAAGFLLKVAFFKPAPPQMAGNVIDIAADMAGFDQDVIRVKASEPVTIRLTSLDNSMHTDGGGKHQWAVDELGVDIVAQPESSNYATFTPGQTGEYNFYCGICCGGRANPAMNGTLIVES